MAINDGDYRTQIEELRSAICEFVYAWDEYRAGNGKGRRFSAIEHKRRQERLNRAERSLREIVKSMRCEKECGPAVNPLLGLGAPLCGRERGHNGKCNPSIPIGAQFAPDPDTVIDMEKVKVTAA